MKYLCLIVLMTTASVLILGCVSRPVTLYSTQIDIEDRVKKKLIVVKEVPLGEVAQVSASFIWDYPGDAGTHSFRFDLFQGDKRLRAGENRNYLFQSSPFKVGAKLSTVAVGIGEYDFILYLDDTKFATVPVKVVEPKP